MIIVQENLEFYELVLNDANDNIANFNANNATTNSFKITRRK